jgi:2-amino-4-hydroxy-6-hydroxymethyldihydropteridine diphosphokinase
VNVTVHKVVIALGANLGDPVAALRGAVGALVSHGITVTSSSSLYSTEPVGGPEQPQYVNAVVVGTTSLAPLDVLDALQDIEQVWGRTREVRWGPRTLDLDLISWDAEVLDSERLTLPHPRAAERGFVLIPWLEAEPDAHLVGSGSVQSLVEALNNLIDADVQVMAGERLT